MVGLGNLPGCRTTTATAVSGDGGVVTGECWLADGVTHRAFVWTAGTGLRSLEDFFALRRVVLGAPLVAPSIHAVSHDGRLLAVVDEDPNLTRSFVIDVTAPLPASPPPPLLAVALALAGFRAARHPPGRDAAQSPRGRPGA